MTLNPNTLEWLQLLYLGLAILFMAIGAFCLCLQTWLQYQRARVDRIQWLADEREAWASFSQFCADKVGEKDVQHPGA